MRKVTLTSLFAVLAALAPAAYAAKAMHHHGMAGKAEKTSTLKGEIVDLDCYLGRGAHGKDHAMCAKMCIKNGAPAGVLEHSGKLTLLIANHDNEQPYKDALALAGGTAEVSGTPAQKGGMRALVVSGVKKD